MFRILGLSGLPALLLLLAFPQLSTAEIPAPASLPLPCRSDPALRGDPAYVLAHRESFVTVGREGCEFPSLAEALARDPDGRTTLCVMDPVHREGGVKLGGKVEILGFGAAATMVEAAARPEDAVACVFEILPGSRVLLSGITIRGGNNTEGMRFGGGIVNNGDLTIEDCAVVENIATAGAGVWSTGPLRIRRSLVAANRIIHRPAAEEAAAIGCRGAGSGLKIDAGCLALMEDCLVAWNSSIKGGAGMHVSCEAEARLSGCVIYGNVAGGRGGGIELAGGRLSLDRCTIAGNEANGGGKALFNRGLLSITGSLVASEHPTAYLRATDGGGDIGIGTLLVNEANYCQSGGLPGAATGEPGALRLGDSGGAAWTLLPEPGSPARGYGAGSR